VIVNPPVNLIDPRVFDGLQALKSFAEDLAHSVRVLVFESAKPEFFGAYVDLVVISWSPKTRLRAVSCPNLQRSCTSGLSSVTGSVRPPWSASRSCADRPEDLGRARHAVPE
jgi:hypothetical protein